MDKYSELEILKRLLDDGAISAEEYEEEKAKILNEETYVRQTELWGMDENAYCMFLHLSQLLGFVVPFGGIVMPIVMWATNKDNNPAVDAHGRAVLNWILSSFIYFIICLFLMIIVIGIFLLPVLIILSLVFAIIGGVKASSGIVWTYPLSIPFFKEPPAIVEQQ